ncbi:MAG: glycosyltransferase family 2 protein [Pseudomonadota bacterium]|nr:glycosyltransferase family 2 protein [Pseudomonadota bacterium]
MTGFIPSADPAALLEPSRKLSIIVPSFNESDSLPELCQRLAGVTGSMGYTPDDYEVLVVNDGSTDGTSERIADLQRDYPALIEIRLRTNFGKSLALMTGFSHARGARVVTMDADLQDNPEDIPVLIRKLDQGYDVVSGWRQKRQDTLIRKIGSRCVNIFLRMMTGLYLHDQNCGFKIYRHEVIKRLYVFGQLHRFIPVQAHLIGYRVTEEPVTNSPRKHGYSKFRTFRYQAAFDFMSLLFTYRCAMTPLHFFGLISVFFLFPGFAVLGWMLLEHLGYILGLGGSGQLVNRPLFILVISTISTGFSILLTGLVCDFMLYHHTRTHMPMILANAVECIRDKSRSSVSQS